MASVLSMMALHARMETVAGRFIKLDTQQRQLSSGSKEYQNALKTDLEKKKQTMDKLCSLNQDLLSTLKNTLVAQKMEAWLDNFAQRWDNLVQKLEKSSAQISQAVTTTQPSLTQTTVMETVTMVTTREQILVKHAQEELPPPPPQKKRQIIVDSEIRKRLDVDITELHSWITRSEAVLQSPEFAIYRKEGNFSDLKEKVNAIEREKAEKFRKLQDASRSAQALVEQMVNGYNITFSKGVNADSIKQASEQLNSRWIEFCQLLSERLNWLEYQNNIITFYNQLQQLEQMTTTAENWLKTQPTTTSEPTTIKSQLNICKDEVHRLSALQPQIERLKIQSIALKEKGQGPIFLDADFVAFTNHFNQVFADVQARERELQTIFDTLPPMRYQETMSTILTWIQQSETKLSIPQVTVTEYDIMEERLGELQALQSSLQEQQSGLNYLSTTVKEMSKKAPLSDISRKYQSEFEEIEGRWKKLYSQLVELCQKLEEQMAKLRKIQLLVNDIQTIQPSLNSVSEGVQKLKTEAEPEFASRLETELRELNTQWDYVCRQVYARKEALKGGLDKTVSLQKDLSEMHEWMTQAEEEYLERDFEYKTPDELQTAVEEMKRAKEEAQQKEAKVKLLTESVNSVIAQAPPAAQEAFKKELDTLTTNYQWLCTRLNGKCKTLEAVRRQKLLEQSIQSAQEIEKSLHLIQESLSSIDKQLAAYIADKVDAAQMPQEAQASKLGMRYYYLNLYKSLSEVKSEVEMVIKTGRQIVQKKQTENPKELDERVTALKLHYNELGAKVTERKQQLEKCLKLSRKMRKEMNALTEWLAATDTELTKRSAVEGMPSNLDSEVAWGKATQKEIEKQKVHLKSVTELGEALKTVLGKKETLVEDKLSLLNSNWIAVTSRAEEWLNLLLRLKAEMNDMRPKVDSTRDQAANLMANRGNHCRKVVEPKISELNHRFAAISHRIKTGKASIPLKELEQFNSDIQKLLEPLEAEIQQGVNLKEEDFNKDMEIDRELQKKKEELNVVRRQAEGLSEDGAAMAVEPTQIQLSKRWREIESKFAQFRRLNFAQIHTVHEESVMVMTEDMPLEISYVPSTYLTEITHVSQALSEVEQLLNAPDLCAKDFEDLFKQEESLKTADSFLMYFKFSILQNIKDSLQQISGRIEIIHKKKTAALHSATPAERAKLQEALSQLDVQWERINKMYKDRQGRFDRSVEKWRRFHYDMKILNQWLTEAEQFLKKTQIPENWEHAKYKWYLKLKYRLRNGKALCGGIAGCSELKPSVETVIGFLYTLLSLQAAGVIREKSERLISRGQGPAPPPAGGDIRDRKGPTSCGENTLQSLTKMKGLLNSSPLFHFLCYKCEYSELCKQRVKMEEFCLTVDKANEEEAEGVSGFASSVVYPNPPLKSEEAAAVASSVIIALQDRKILATVLLYSRASRDLLAPVSSGVHVPGEREGKEAEGRGSNGRMLQYFREEAMELQDGIGQRQTVVKVLNATGEEVIQQSSKTDASILQEKLGSLNLRWQEVCKQLVERKKRLEEQKNILSEFQRDVDEFVLWLEEVDNVASIPLEPGNEQQLKEKLEQVKVSRDLPEKQGEIEAHIKDLGQLEEQLNHLLLWLSPIRNQLEIYNKPNQTEPFDIKEIEVAVQAKQPDVEGILSKGQHLYKEKPATQPVKRKLEDLSSDWKAVTHLLQELRAKQPGPAPGLSTVGARKYARSHAVWRQPFQKHNSEVPALADFNRAWTELTDWLSLLDRVIKSQRVMVGDLEDINEMIIKQK
ncbi:hypothetical protein GH733_019305, partial [Mirounga leonina]